MFVVREQLNILHGAFMNLPLVCSETIIIITTF
nr:MAG TPA: hypothetical protein [Caudoviricetes sp.]